MKFSFCELSTATPFSQWHIRKLSANGHKLGGGIDTNLLCRDNLINGWDLDVPFDEDRLETNLICEKCVEKYFNITLTPTPNPLK